MSPESSIIYHILDSYVIVKFWTALIRANYKPK